MKYLVTKIAMVVMSCSLSGFGQSLEDKTSKTIMLILGSGSLEGSVARAEVGFNLYQSRGDFDYIVVSGGCGAHTSSICEATIMADVLIGNGVPPELVFKEEKSRSTAQNYCYSRDLRHPDGSKIITPGDRLYVVSNHWHAMSVAGCFSDKDLVPSKYVIEGSIIPKPENTLDYGAMYEKCMNNPNYCKSVLWPKVDAAYSAEATGSKTDINLFVADLVTTHQRAFQFYTTITQKFPDLPELWTSNTDASYYNAYENLIYLFKGPEFIAMKPGSSKIEKGYPKKSAVLFSNLSENWTNGAVDAAFFNPTTKQTYLFKGDQYVRLTYKKNKSPLAEDPKKISELIENWPFKWSTGDLDAATFDERNQEVILYRGQEMLTLRFEGEELIIVGEPKKIDLEWPIALWGERN